MGIIGKVARACVAVCFAVSAQLALADATLDQARRLLAEKKPKEAYNLLLPLEDKRAGDVEFDYLLGIAALDAGDAQRAVFALERVLAVNPNYLQARAEIARAYFVLGERENARREFASVKAQEPPKDVQRTIDQYLSVLTPQQTLFRAFIEGSFGYDSNVNSATARSQIAIPGIGIGTLNPLAVKQGDQFFAVNAGGSVNHAISDRWWLVGSAGYNGKFNTSVDNFDLDAFDLSAGARWVDGRHSVVALGQGQKFRVDYNTFRNLYGGTAQYLYSVTPQAQVSVFGQYAALRYPDQDPRDANRLIGGLAYSQAFSVPFAPVAFASAYYGQEKERDKAYPWLGHKPLGVRVGGQVTPIDKLTVFTAGFYENRRYNGADPFFLEEREDDQYDWRIGVSYAFAPKWSVTPQFQKTWNKSNIELYQYDRSVTSVAIRRDF